MALAVAVVSTMVLAVVAVLIISVVVSVVAVGLLSGWHQLWLG